MKNKMFLLIILFIAIIGAVGVYHLCKDKQIKTSDAQKFSEEYTLVSKENIFKYKTIDEIINIIEDGTGIVFLGFKECPWCQHYAAYLNEIAISNNIKEIYYFDIKEDRNENSEKYQKITKLLESVLLNDDSGKKRVYVPDVTFIKNGKIIAHDNETSIISDGTLPEDYWSTVKVEELKTKISGYIKSYTGACSTCN